MGWRNCYWLDFPKFASVLNSKLTDTELVATKYFTSRVKTPAEKAKRQGDYLDALKVRGNIHIVYGDYKEEQYKCSSCGRPNFIQKEKQTDVGIAVEMLLDAHLKKFDVAILVSGDSDLVPSIKAAKEINPCAQVIACFPPRRHSKEIRQYTNGQIHINEVDLRNCQLPDSIQTPGAYQIKRPDSCR